MLIETAFAGVWLRWYCKRDGHINIEYASTDGDTFRTKRVRFTANGCSVRSN